jgi:hypothetical protein
VKANIEASGKDKLSDDEVFAQIQYAATRCAIHLYYTELMKMTGRSSSLAMKRVAQALVGRSTCSRRTRVFKTGYVKKSPEPRLKPETNKFLLKFSLLSPSSMPSW